MSLYYAQVLVLRIFYSFNPWFSPCEVNFIISLACKKHIAVVQQDRNPSSLAPEFGLSTTVLFTGMFAHISKMSSPDFHFILFSSSTRRHTSQSSHLGTLIIPCRFHGFTAPASCYYSECPFSSSSPRKLLFIPQSPVQCHLSSDACPIPILDRMTYSPPFRSYSKLFVLHNVLTG